jgi:hypothetical protein
MTRRFFLLLLTLALCAGPTARAVEQDLYNPLAVGLRWDVDVEVTPPGGNVIHGKAVREITGTQKINGLYYFVVNTTFENVPKIKDFTTYRRKTARGVFAINAADPEKRECLESVLPLTVGQSWKTIVGMMPITSTVEGKESVTVGGRTYDNCIKVSTKTGVGPNSVYYQAPDVGNVLETTTIDGIAFKFSLSKYSGLK